MTFFLDLRPIGWSWKFWKSLSSKKKRYSRNLCHESVKERSVGTKETSESYEVRTHHPGGCESPFHGSRVREIDSIVVLHTFSYVMDHSFISCIIFIPLYSYIPHIRSIFDTLFKPRLSFTCVWITSVEENCSFISRVVLIYNNKSIYIYIYIIFLFNLYQNY